MEEGRIVIEAIRKRNPSVCNLLFEYENFPGISYQCSADSTSGRVFKTPRKSTCWDILC